MPYKYVENKRHFKPEPIKHIKHSFTGGNVTMYSGINE